MITPAKLTLRTSTTRTSDTEQVPYQTSLSRHSTVRMLSKSQLTKINQLYLDKVKKKTRNVMSDRPRVIEIHRCCCSFGGCAGQDFSWLRIDNFFQEKLLENSPGTSCFYFCKSWRTSYLSNFLELFASNSSAAIITSNLILIIKLSQSLSVICWQFQLFY
jgi:hypothetical protein